MTMINRIVCLLSLAAVCSPFARADTLLTESFSYGGSVGQQIPPNSGGVYTEDDGDLGDGANTFGEDIGFSGYETTGQSAVMDSQESMSRAVANTNSLEEMGAVFMSGVFSADIGSDAWGGASLCGFQLMDEAGARNGIVLGLTNGDVTDGAGAHNEIHAHLFIDGRINNNPAESADALVATNNLSAGTNYFLIGKTVITNAAGNFADLYLLVIPEGETIPEEEGDVIWSAVKQGVAYGWPLTSANDLDTIMVGQGNTPGTNNVADELRIGSAYADILPPPLDPSRATLIMLK